MTRWKRNHSRKRSYHPEAPLHRGEAATSSSRLGWALGWRWTALRRYAVAVGTVAMVVVGVTLALVWRAGRQSRDPVRELRAYVPRPKGTLTFSKDVAPITFAKCAGCHQPDDAAPFSLLTYEQVRKHARQIVELTAQRIMPPWPPEPGYGDFVGARLLTTDELGVLSQWEAEGAPEGNPGDLPAAPPAAPEWQLGQPDLVVTMPQAYTVPAEGRDIYRNFVFPIPVSSNRYVRAVQFKPRNAKVVHHAFIDVDETRQSRRLAEKQNPPGFDGMELPDTAVMPAGQFLGWQPGKGLYKVPAGLAWILRTNTDLVLQMHLFRSGKSEVVQPTIGFYFTDSAPTNLPFRLRLLSYELAIPPGDDHYVVEQSYVLPIDVSLLRVNPHAHYLGKDLQGFALLPNGERKWLLWIKDWNFNWQGDYEYAQPIKLPKGAKIVMRYTYDNSTNNIRNPHQPPQEVGYGLASSDEMAALGFQVLARNSSDRQLLGQDYQKYLAQVSVDYCRFQLRKDPNDAKAHTKLASFLVFQGKAPEALDHLRTAIRVQPDYDPAHYELGQLYLGNNQIKEAWREFETVIRLNPTDFQAYGNLGFISLKQGHWPEAQKYFEAALRINPDDEVARKNLTLVKTAQAPH